MKNNFYTLWQHLEREFEIDWSIGNREKAREKAIALFDKQTISIQAEDAIDYITYLLSKKLSSVYYQGEALEDFKIYLQGLIPALNQKINESPMDQNYIKEMRQYLEYINHDEIANLVEKVNLNERDFNFIKLKLRNQLEGILNKLPIQNQIFENKIKETFCLLVNNDETKLKEYWSVSIISPNKKTANFGDNRKIAKLKPLAKIAFEEWVEDIKEEPKYKINYSLNQNFEREFQDSSFPFKEVFDNTVSHKETLFEEYKRAPLKPSKYLFLRQYYTDEERNKGFGDANKNIPVVKSKGNVPIAASFVPSTYFELRVRDLDARFYELSKGTLSQDVYCPNIAETKTYKILNEIQDLFENFYTCVEANNEISPIDVAKRIITKLESFEDYTFRINIMKVLLDKNPTEILDIICRLGYKDKKDVDNIKNLWFAKQTSFKAHLEEEIKRLVSKIDIQSVAPPLLSLSTFSRSFTEKEQDHLYDGLIKHGFIANNTNQYHFNFVFGGTPIPQSEEPFERITWVKPTERVKTSTSRKAFFNLLYLLQVSHNEISDSKLLNSLFLMQTGKKLTTTNKNDAQNDNFISEYNDVLSEILDVNKSLKN